MSTQKKASDQMRDSEGRYRHDFERVCRCGHRNGEHTGARVKWEGVWRQDCLVAGCDCECFKLSRGAK